MIDAGDVLLKGEVFGSEQETSRDRQSLVDHHAFVRGHLDAAADDASRAEIVEGEFPIEANGEDAGLGGFREEAGPRGHGMAVVFEGPEVEHLYRPGGGFRRMLDGNPTEQGIADRWIITQQARPLWKVALGFGGRYKQRLAEE